MIFLVSGEGRTDMGICAQDADTCEGPGFLPGPMAWIVDRLVEPLAGFSVIESQTMYFVSESALANDCRQLPMTLSRGKKRDYETAHFFKNARAMARRAKKFEGPKCPVCAVLFHDTDESQSARGNLFDTKWHSMMDGFSAEGFDRGVPMIAQPKSEAWLLCALKRDPYVQCEGLETDLSGNDNSPNSAKSQLNAILEEQNKTYDDVADLVRDGIVDPKRIDMPSCHRFRTRLEDVTREMLGCRD